jgi:hypothetical protein
MHDYAEDLMHDEACLHIENCDNTLWSGARTGHIDFHESLKMGIETGDT